MRLKDAKALMEEALELLEPLANEDRAFSAFVYEQITEHVENSNPYNESLVSVLKKLETEGE